MRPGASDPNDTPPADGIPPGVLAFGGGGAGAGGDEVPRDIVGGGGGGGAGGAAVGLPCLFIPNAFIAACCAKPISLCAPFVCGGIGGGAGGVARE